jgi:hypothetical protein
MDGAFHDHVLAFNDLHCVFAAARSPDDHAIRFVRSLDDFERTSSGDNRQVAVDVGRRRIGGAFAFAAGRYAHAVEAILPVRGKRFGLAAVTRSVKSSIADRSGRAISSLGLGGSAPGQARPRPRTPRAKAQHRRTVRHLQQRLRPPPEEI